MAEHQCDKKRVEEMIALLGDAVNLDALARITEVDLMNLIVLNATSSLLMTEIKNYVSLIPLNFKFVT